MATTSNKNTSKKKKSFYTISGIDIHIAKKFAVYEFGDFYFKMEKNLNERCYDLYLFEKKEINGKLTDIQKPSIDKFSGYFGNTIRLMVVPLKFI